MERDVRTIVDVAGIKKGPNIEHHAQLDAYNQVNMVKTAFCALR